LNGFFNCLFFDRYEQIISMHTIECGYLSRQAQDVVFISFRCCR